MTPVTKQPTLSVAAISLGCPKNLVDTEVMFGLIKQASYRIVNDLAYADVLLVNTCCFVEDARKESAEALHEAVAWKISNRDRILICAGCWPQMDPAALKSHFPEVDAFIGPGDVPRIVEVIERAQRWERQLQPSASPSSFTYDDSLPRLRATAPWTAYLKIAEGCNHRCRFCVIPRLRGRQRSRAPESIAKEARQMAREGVREIVLVAQDTTAYGHDLKGPNLAELMSALDRIEGLRWIRLLYAYPSEVTQGLIEMMAGSSRICHYLDLPFQHADREALRRMGRPGEAARYLCLIARLRAAMPDIAIRTTFLLGFPGESKCEFNHLLEFVQEAQFDRVGAFCYSPERGTSAAEMPDQVPPETAQQRYHELMALQQEISLARNRSWLGRNIEVLIESPGDSRREWIGRSFRDAPEIDGNVIVKANSNKLAPGQFTKAEVIAAEPYDLIGVA